MDDFAKDIADVGRIAAVPAILDLACRITGMGFAAVARVTDDRWIACSVRDNIAFGLEPGGELKVETTICNEIRDHRSAVVFDDALADPHWREHHTPKLYGLRSYISLPILLPDGRFFGTLCAIDPAPHHVNTPEVVGTFRLFAELIAIHLDALDKVAASDADLAAAHENAALREQFIAVLGHDLRNPVAAVQAAGVLLDQETLSDRGRRVVRLMHESTQRMAGLIDNILDFARGRLGGGLTLERRSDPLAPMLELVVRELRASHPTRVIEAELDLSGTVDCDHGRIAQLFSNLLGNAITHGAPDRPVTARATTAAGMFELSVANGGAPIPPVAMAKLFQPFARGDVRPNQQGLGLGLYIAWEIARAHGGAIEVASDESETRFTFRMSLA